MKLTQPGFLRGVLKHLGTMPRIMLTVGGWPNLFADILGLKKKPYLLKTQLGVCCTVRPGTSDWWIFLEIFVFKIYGRVTGDISEAKTIIDIGANVGFFAIHAASLNPGTQVFAFEPFPKNSDQLKVNLQLNPASQVRVFTSAVSEKSGSATLFFTPGDDSGCSLNLVKGQSLIIDTIGVNELFQLCGISKCDLLKMDCEGSELPILQVASAQLLANIRTIIMEYHKPEEVKLLLDILKQAGFQCEILKDIKTLYASRS